VHADAGCQEAHEEERCYLRRRRGGREAMRRRRRRPWRFAWLAMSWCPGSEQHSPGN